MKKRALMTVVALLVTACTPVRWTWQHAEGLGPEKLQEDSRFCDALSREEADYWQYDSYSPYVPYTEPYYVYRSPYWHRHYDPFWYGYSWYPDSFSYYRYLNDLFRVCMRAKGWQRVPLTDAEDLPPGEEYGP